MPSAFDAAGAKLAASSICVFAVLALICVLYVLEVNARAEGVYSHEVDETPGLGDGENADVVEEVTIQDGEVKAVAVEGYPREEGEGEEEEEERRRRRRSEHAPLLERDVPVHRVAYRRFDFVASALLFGGRKMQVFVQGVMGLYVYGCLWSFVSVFASTADTLFFKYVLTHEKGDCNIYHHPNSSCMLGYYIAVGIFGVFVVAVALRDVSEQKALQVAMTTYRFVAFAMILGTSLVALWSRNTWDPVNSTDHAPYVSKALDPVKWSGFGTAFTFSAVALNVHYNMPNVIQPIVAPKSNLVKVATAGILVATACYLILGYVCGLVFGSGTIPLITLNWDKYTGHAGGWGEGDTLWWAYILKIGIMLFPMLDMLTVYPIICVTLGDNLFHSAPEALIQFAHDRFHLGKRGCQLFFRILTAVPPLGLGMYTGNLSEIFTITGLFAFFLELIIPPLLWLQSYRYCVRKWGVAAAKTQYATVFSREWIAWSVLTIGFAAFLFAVYVVAGGDV